jgi:hypothetical protein
MESGLNHLLMTCLDNPALRDVISQLPTGDRRFGKLAFITAYKLLPENALLFAQLLSKIRNDAVHKSKYFELNLKAYFQGLEINQLNNWKTALTSWCGFANLSTEPVEIDEKIKETAIREPRAGIYNSVMAIIYRSLILQCGMELSLQLPESQEPHKPTSKE